MKALWLQIHFSYDRLSSYTRFLKLFKYNVSTCGNDTDSYITGCGYTKPDMTQRINRCQSIKIYTPERVITHGAGGPRYKDLPIPVAQPAGLPRGNSLLMCHGHTLTLLKPEYWWRNRPMPWLLMPWLLASPRYQQPWCWVSGINVSVMENGLTVPLPSAVWKIRTCLCKTFYWLNQCWHSPLEHICICMVRIVNYWLITIIIHIRHDTRLFFKPGFEFRKISLTSALRILMIWRHRN